MYNKLIQTINIEECDVIDVVDAHNNLLGVIWLSAIYGDKTLDEKREIVNKLRLDAMEKFGDDIKFNGYKSALNHSDLGISNDSSNISPNNKNPFPNMIQILTNARKNYKNQVSNKE